MALKIMKMLVRAEKLNRLLGGKLDEARVIEESLCDRVRTLEEHVSSRDDANRYVFHLFHYSTRLV
jgi:hypothetical protein